MPPGTQTTTAALTGPGPLPASGEGDREDEAAVGLDLTASFLLPLSLGCGHSGLCGGGAQAGFWGLPGLRPAVCLAGLLLRGVTQ